MRIGFVGLGNMGAPMARNLAEAGHTVVGYDTQVSPQAPINAAADLQSLAQQSDAVITMLPNGAAVAAVTDTLLPHLRPDTLVIDCSTADVATSRAVATKLQEAGHAPVDAPVSGGTAGADAGALTFMVGGSADAIARAEPLFAIMGARHFHCGDSGSGQAAKICNNMILGISMIATCEAFALADGLGLDREALFRVVSASSGQNWSMSTYCPAPGIGPESPADRDYQPGFAAALMLKDLMLSQDAAEEAGVPTVMGSKARDLYEAYVGTGNGGRDFSAILHTLTKQT